MQAPRTRVDIEPSSTGTCFAKGRVEPVPPPISGSSSAATLATLASHVPRCRCEKRRPLLARSRCVGRLTILGFRVPMCRHGLRIAGVRHVAEGRTSGTWHAPAQPPLIVDVIGYDLLQPLVNAHANCDRRRQEEDRHQQP